MTTSTRNGVDLREDHLAHLHSSAISDEVIRMRGYQTVLGAYGVEQLERRFAKGQRRAGILIPLYRVGEQVPHTYLLRPNEPRHDKKGKAIKYEFPKGVQPCVDVLPAFREQLGDPGVDFWITEGAKKADALASLGLLAANLNGVFGWRGKNSFGGKAALPDFEAIALNGRKVVLAFDSDFIRNEKVMTALRRLGVFLASRGASVHSLSLPQFGDGKVGVDDFLVTLEPNQRLTQLEGHLVPLSATAGTGIDKIGKNPETGRLMYNPRNYMNQGGILTCTNPSSGRTKNVYSGHIAVVARGRHYDTGAETLTVGFDVGGERRRITAPRVELATARGATNHLAAVGAAVHEGNARDVAQFLIEFASLNAEALPYRQHSPRLGVTREGGLLTPAGAIGTDVIYAGPYEVAGGSDLEAYPRALRAMVGWGADAFPALLALGASLASPAIARLHPRRSPVLYFSGPSGAGKTTACLFAIGAWGDPTVRPFRIEAGHTTPKGYLQALTEMGGLPLFVDEAHTARQPEHLESVVYSFANGQSYTRGGIDGQVLGGEYIGGSLLLAGEALPELQNVGAQKRLLCFAGEFSLPFGAEPCSDLGRERAAILEHAWHQGHGLLGPTIANVIWGDWTSFQSRVESWRVKTRHLGPWEYSIAIVAATLDMLSATLQLETQELLNYLPDFVKAVLEGSASESDPARRAYEAIMTMLAQAEIDEGPAGKAVARLNRDAVAWYDVANCYVMTGTPQFSDRVGKKAVGAYGKTWSTRGWITADDKGNSSKSVYSPILKQSVRAIVIPLDQLERAG